MLLFVIMHRNFNCFSLYFQKGILKQFEVCSFHAPRTLRLSVGRETNEKDVEQAVLRLKLAANKLIDKQNCSEEKSQVICNLTRNLL